MSTLKKIVLMLKRKTFRSVAHRILVLFTCVYSHYVNNCMGESIPEFRI